MHILLEVLSEFSFPFTKSVNRWFGSELHSELYNFTQQIITQKYVYY